METKLTKYIVPNVLAMLGMSCYILADTFFISVAQGANGITALNLVLPLYGLIYALGAMLGVGSATRYSLAKSLESEQADHYFFNSVFYAVSEHPVCLGWNLCPGAGTAALGRRR